MSTTGMTKMELQKMRLEAPHMVTIPAGEVYMGTSDGQLESLLLREEWAEEWYERDLFVVEQPQHSVMIPRLEIGKFPVTNAQYYLFVWSSGYRIPRTWEGFQYESEKENHPVAGVSKDDVEAYCKWLNNTLKSNYRLPTEAEWERAARGSDGRMYPWGNVFDPWRCNTTEGSRKDTTIVGEFSPSGDSPFGVCDMAGNVMEWTSSYLLSYPYKMADGREEPQKTKDCVVRGGGWYYSRKLARSAAREGVMKTYQSNSLGFRLARTP